MYKGGIRLDKFINIAQVQALAGDSIIRADSAPWVIRKGKMCICQCVALRFDVCDLACLRESFIYHTGVEYVDNNGNPIVVAGYGVQITYLDCCGDRRRTSKESRVVFSNLPEDFDPTQFTVRFVDLHTEACCDEIKASFTAKLCNNQSI